MSLVDIHTSATSIVALPIAGDQIAVDAGPQGDSTDAAANGLWDSLAPGDSVEFTATYEMTQRDVDADRAVTNTVVVTSVSPDGVNPDANDTASVTPIAPAPEMTVIKTISAIEGKTAGDLVSFEITVENTGNVTLSNVSLSDTLTDLSGQVLSLDNGPDYVSGNLPPASILSVGETWLFTAEYTLTQADIDAGGIANTVTATAYDPSGEAVMDVSDDNGVGSDPTQVVIDPVPAMELVKAITSSTVAVGEAVTFELSVTNTGNVTLSGVQIASDTLTRADGTVLTLAYGPNYVSSDLGSGSGILLPDETATYKAGNVLVQADTDAGSIVNTATASHGATVSNADSQSIDAIQSPAMSVTKVADTMLAQDFITGATARYTYTVTNTGNTTLTSAISFSDNLISAADITCPIFPTAGLAPNGTYECTAQYQISQNDVALGSVTNIAGATSGTTMSPTVSETIPNQGTPALAITKTAAAGSSFDTAGDVVDYTYVVTNSGQVAFVSDLYVHDDKIGALRCWVALPGDLDFIAGETATCQASYTVTQQDVDAGFVTNLAYAQVDYVGDEVSSDVAEVTVTGVENPDITLEKSAVPAAFSAAGDVIGYDFVVTNSGN